MLRRHRQQAFIGFQTKRNGLPNELRIIIRGVHIGTTAQGIPEDIDRGPFH